MGMPETLRRPTLLARKLRNEATDAERRLWGHLRRRQLGGFKFSRQMPVGPFVCDFICREASLVVEVDGGQHDVRSAEDARRSRFIEREGFRVLRFWNNEVLDNTEGVLQAILSELAVGPTPDPSRPREGS